MMNLLKRKEPVIAFGEEPAQDDRDLRTARQAPTGDLTRRIRKGQSQDELDRIARTLGLSTATSEAISVELLSNGGPLLGEDAVKGAMDALFDCEPVGAMTPRPVIFVGGSPDARMRAAIALSQRIERAGRRVALFSLDERQSEDAQATFRGGLDILHLGTADACIDAVRVKEPAELAIVEASCLDGDTQEGANALQLLALGLGAEVIYVEDGQSALPDPSRVSGVERLILSGRPRPERFGAILDAAYRRRWAFAGQCSEQGIWHPVTPTVLASRFAMAVL